MSDDLGPKPEPDTEPPEHYPGGADAIDDSGEFGDTPGGPATRDLHPDDNPGVEDALPEDIAAPDNEKQQEPDGTSGEDDPPDEPPA